MPSAAPPPAPAGCGALVRKVCLIWSASSRLYYIWEEDDPVRCPEYGYNCYCDMYCMDCAAAAGCLDEATRIAWDAEKRPSIGNKQLNNGQMMGLDGRDSGCTITLDNGRGEIQKNSCREKTDIGDGVGSIHGD